MYNNVKIFMTLFPNKTAFIILIFPCKNKKRNKKIIFIRNEKK